MQENPRMRNIVADALTHRHLPFALAALAMVLALPALWVGLQLDDYGHRMVLQGRSPAGKDFGLPVSMFCFADGSPGHMQELMDIGIVPWWTLENVRLAFWRPVSVITHRLDYRLWPDSLPLMHLHSLVWFGAVVALVAALYRRLMGGGWAAGLAALLFAVDDAHAMPAAWLANRNGLVAAFFGLLAVVLHDQWRGTAALGCGRRRDGARAAAFLAPGCLLLALLSSEAGIAACGYLLAYAVCLDRGSWRARASSLVQYGAVVVAWRLVYSATGHGVFGSETYIDPLHSPLRFLAALWVRLPVLLLAQWALPPSDLFTFVPAMARFALWGLSLVFLVLLLAVLIPLLRQDRVARFWLLGMALALVPCCATFPMDRLLIMAGVGAMGLLAQFLGAVRTGTLLASLRPSSRAFARPLYFAFIVLHLILAPVLMPLRICGFTALGNHAAACIDSAPLDASVVDRTVILTNAPNFFYASYLIILRAYNGEPLPAYVRCLGPNMGLPLEPIQVTRTGERTLTVTSEGGFQWLFMRDKGHPLDVGEKVELTGMSAEVTKLAEEGWPLEVAYQFDVRLEDPSLVWLKMEQNAFVPFTPPPVGASTVLNQ